MCAARFEPVRPHGAGRAGWCLAAAVAAALWQAPAARCDDGAGEPESYVAANGFLNRGLYDLAVEEYRKFLAGSPGDARAGTARYGLGVALYRLKRFRDAAQELERVAVDKRFAFGAETLTVLGECRLEAREFEGAAEAFRRAATEFRDHDLSDSAAAGWTEALYRCGKHDEALVRARELAARRPDSPARARSEYFAALSELARGDSAGAARRLSEYVKQRGDGPYVGHARLLLAQALAAEGKLDEAALEYERAAADPDGPYRGHVLYGLASIRARQGDYAGAGELLDRALADSPTGGGAGAGEAGEDRGPLLRRAHLLRARCRLEAGDTDSAAAELEPLRGDGDADLASEAAYWLARCRLRGDRPSEAVGILDDALSRRPDNRLRAEMMYDRAVGLVRCGEVRRAADGLGEFLQAYPKHDLTPDALHLLACALHQLKDYDGAAARCREFLKRFGGHALACEVEFLAAEGEYLAGRLEGAVDGYRAVLERAQRGVEADKARYRLGLALHRLGRTEEAYAYLSATPAAAEFGAAALVLGDIHFQRGEWEEAERRLGEYLASNREAGGADDALLKLGLARQRRGRFAEGLKAFDELLARFPASPHRNQAVFERGQALLALKRDDEAVEAFRQAADGDDARFKAYALSHLGAIAYGRGEYEKASGLFARVGDESAGREAAPDAGFQQGMALMAAGRLEQAEAALREFVAAHPKHERAAEAAAQRGICLSRLDRHDEAVRVLEKVEREAGERLDTRLKGAVGYERAWCLRRLGKDDQAAPILRALVTEGGGAPDPYAALELADIELRAKRPAAAAELLRGVRERIAAGGAKAADDLVESVTYRLAAAEYEQEHFAPAAALFEEVAARFPEGALSASAALLAGECHARGGRPERAVDWLARAAARPPDDAGRATALLRLGESHAALQQWSRSEKAFGDFLASYPGHDAWYQARFGVGWARENQGRHEEAIEAYRGVVERHKGATAARAQFQIGECLMAREKLDEAVRELLKVDILYDYPEWSAAANYEAGRCFEKLGKTVEARRQFAVVTEKHKESRWAELAARRMAELPADPRRGG